jgi:hypothetical protein
VVGETVPAPETGAGLFLRRLEHSQLVLFHFLVRELFRHCEDENETYALHFHAWGLSDSDGVHEWDCLHRNVGECLDDGDGMTLVFA